MNPAKPATLFSCGKPSPAQLLWGIIFGVSVPLGLLALRRLTLPIPVRYLIPCVCLIAGIAYMWAMVRDIRRQLDELQLRIYLEAAAVMVCGVFVMMLAYPVLQAAGYLKALEYTDVLLLLFVLGGGAYFNALRRYR
jgi:hypothetical protein